jgi:AcrR family transcriptional regulator
VGKVRVPRVVREQQMLDAAVAVFSQRGYHAAGMDDIAERAGISKPMVYAYLGTKEELFVACLHREGTRLMQAVLDAVSPQASPDEQLWRGLRAFFRFVGAHRDAWSVLYRQARGQEPFAAEVAAMRSRMVEVVAGLLARSGGTGDVTPVAYALVGAIESMADWVVDNVEEDPEVAATRLMNLVWLGFDRLLAGDTWRADPGTGSHSDSRRVG